MKIFVYDNCFLVGKHWWLQSFTMYVQLIVVIAYMCTRKVTGSRRSLLTLFSCQPFCNLVYTFPSKQLELLQNNYWCLNIHSVQNHLSESLWFAFSYRSACIYEENTSKYWWRFFFNSSRFWHLPGTDISLRSCHHCPDHYHTSYAVVTRKRKGRPILCSCPENSELLVHSDWGRPFPANKYASRYLIWKTIDL